MEDKMNLKSFLSFDRMITPVIIKVLFYIFLIAAAIAGVVTFFGGIVSAFSEENFMLALGGLVGGPLVFLLGALVARIYCELLILAFQIHENLVEIKESLKK
jgi:hypothetical protein